MTRAPSAQCRACFAPSNSSSACAGSDARRDLEVIFQPSLIAVENQIDSGINIFVAHAGKLRNTMPPLRRIVAQNVIALAGRRSRRRSTRHSGLAPASFIRSDRRASEARLRAYPGSLVCFEASCESEIAGSRPRTRDTGCSRSRGRRTWRGRSAGSRLPCPWLGSNISGRPANSERACDFRSARLGRRSFAEPRQTGSGSKLRLAKAGQSGPQRIGGSGVSGNPTRESCILPPTTPARRPEHELVPRMFPTNGDLRSRVPPMQYQIISLSQPFFYLAFRPFQFRSCSLLRSFLRIERS